jgi:hypothetical protein
VQEQIIEGVNGWIVENNQDAITSKLIEIANSQDKLVDMRKSLINYQYDNETIFKEYIDALEGKL